MSYRCLELNILSHRPPPMGLAFPANSANSVTFCWCVSFINPFQCSAHLFPSKKKKKTFKKLSDKIYSFENPLPLPRCGWGVNTHSFHSNSVWQSWPLKCPIFLNTATSLSRLLWEQKILLLLSFWMLKDCVSLKPGSKGVERFGILEEPGGLHSLWRKPTQDIQRGETLSPFNQEGS